MRHCSYDDENLPLKSWAASCHGGSSRIPALRNTAAHKHSSLRDQLGVVLYLLGGRFMTVELVLPRVILVLAMAVTVGCDSTPTAPTVADVAGTWDGSSATC